MKFKKIIALTMGAGMAVSTAALAACAGGGDGSAAQAEYQVVYNLNYGSGEDVKRELTVSRGFAGVNWQPRRDGYDLEGWYTDKSCTKKYDFTKGVYSDTELYAHWVTARAVYSVKIDGNFAGVKNYKTLSVKDGDKIDESVLPNIFKFAMELDGWYTDSECTTPYDFNSPVKGDFTLYPKYKFNDKISRYDYDLPDYGIKKGDIKFDELQLNIWYGNNMTSQYKGLTGNRNSSNEILREEDGSISVGEIDKLVDAFNSSPENIQRDANGDPILGENGQPKKRIVVKTSSGSLTQSEYQLRMQPTPEKNKSNKNYLNISAVLDAANVDSSYYNSNDWYALNDSLVSGGLGSVPLGCKVPFLIYNKAQMNKYCGENTVPHTYSEFSEVLKKAYAGENAATAGYKSLLMNGYWPFGENMSMISFVQNGAPYYTFDAATKKYSSGWANDSVKAKAVTAAENLYNLVSANGDCHGGFSSLKDRNDDIILENVTSGKAIAGIISWYNDLASSSSSASFILNRIANDDNIGILPLSGLFTDDTTGIYKDAIPVHTVGLQICTYMSAKSDTDYAACSVFADYVARHAENFIEQGLVPMNKEVYKKYILDVPEEEASDVVKVMKKMGNPENFFTLDGHANQKALVTEIGGVRDSTGAIKTEGYLDRILALATTEGISAEIDKAAARLKSNFGN